MKKLSMLIILLFITVICDAVLAANGTISGRLLLNTGSPMAQASVYLFDTNREPLPQHGKFWKIPDQVTSSDNQGRFSLSVPPGEYLLAATLHHSKERLGPPVAGDYFLSYAGPKGTYRRYSVKDGVTTDIGTIKGIAPASQKDIAYRYPITGISGVVRDTGGRPLQNAIVVAYDNPAMQGPPLFTSPKTKADGAYVLGVHAAGTYYLRVRDVFGGGRPQQGSILGMYSADDEPAGITVEKDKVTGSIDITVERFTERGSAPQ